MERDKEEERVGEKDERGETREKREWGRLGRGERGRRKERVDGDRLRYRDTRRVRGESEGRRKNGGGVERETSHKGKEIWRERQERGGGRRENRVQETHHHHHHLSLNRKGRWGTTDDFATSFLHFSLLSTAL